MLATKEEHQHDSCSEQSSRRQRALTVWDIGVGQAAIRFPKLYPCTASEEEVSAVCLALSTNELVRASLNGCNATFQLLFAGRQSGSCSLC